MRRFFLLCMTLAAPVRGHVGSPDAFFEGDAGPYHLFVTIRKPGVIPGVAQIELRSRTGDLREIKIAIAAADHFDPKLLPVPDVAERSKTDPQFFTCPIWLMTDGPMVAMVRLDGAGGKAELAIPFTSYPQGTLPLGKALGTALFGLMLFLSAGVVSIVAAFVREGDLGADALPGRQRLRRSRLVAASVAAVVAGLVWAAGSWWDSEGAAYLRHVTFFDPPKLEASLESPGSLMLVIGARSPRWAAYTKRHPLVPDHGHLMHLFLIRVPELDRMWHLHPERRASDEFTVGLPALDAGRYRLFGDVVDENGFPWTAVGEIDLPQTKAPQKGIGEDDSGWSGAGIASAEIPRAVSPLSDGARMVWLPPALRAGVATQFRFRVENADGSPATGMEPYMGMAGHAEFVRSDLAVFAHLHPAGTAPMPALALVQTVHAMDGMPAMHHMDIPPEVTFPYAFPSAGKYRIFVQIKRSGRVETGVFDATVE